MKITKEEQNWIKARRSGTIKASIQDDEIKMVTAASFRLAGHIESSTDYDTLEDVLMSIEDDEVDIGAELGHALELAFAVCQKAVDLLDKIGKNDKPTLKGLARSNNLVIKI